MEESTPGQCVAHVTCRIRGMRLVSTSSDGEPSSLQYQLRCRISTVALSTPSCITSNLAHIHDVQLSFLSSVSKQIAMSAPGGAPSPAPRSGSMGPGANGGGMPMSSQPPLSGTPVHQTPSTGPPPPQSGAMSQQNLNQIVSCISYTEWILSRTPDSGTFLKTPTASLCAGLLLLAAWKSPFIFLCWNCL